MPRHWRTGHRGWLPSCASKVETLAEQYKCHDEDAGSAQARFNSAMMRADGAVLATAVLAALIMVGGIFEPRFGETLMRPPLLVLGLLALLAGALASMWLFRVREGQLLDEWMTERAHAETARLAYFTSLVKEPAPTASDPPLGLLKLEYFRRYLLDMQIAYYGRRGRLDDVRAGVLAGSQDVLEEYVAAVQEQLSLEHREWLSGAESTRSAIGKLDETLGALQKREAEAAR